MSPESKYDTGLNTLWFVPPVNLLTVPMHVFIFLESMQFTSGPHSFMFRRSMYNTYARYRDICPIRAFSEPSPIDTMAKLRYTSRFSSLLPLTRPRLQISKYLE